MRDDTFISTNRVDVNPPNPNGNSILSELSWQKPKTKREGWVNIYEKHRACWRYDTKEEADLFATLAQGGIDPSRIACVRCEWEE